jgi:hypothetical protein
MPGEREARNQGCRGDPERRLVLSRDSEAKEEVALVLASVLVSVWVFLQPLLFPYVLKRKRG